MAAPNMFVRDGGSWKQVKGVWVRDAGSWKSVKAAWVRDGGAWKQFYASAYSFTPTISSDTANYSIRAAALAAGWDGTTPLNATITINAIVYSTSTGTPAFQDGGTIPTGSAISVIINSGKGIYGAGGIGGSALAGAGSPGGTALYTRYAMSITNNGTIGGGGGGGGAANRGSGDWLYGGLGPDQTMGGGGGGGGQGYNNPAGGAGDYGAYFPGNAGSAGSSSGGGAGGNPGQVPSWGGYGGNGGSWGNAGASASAIYASGASNAGGAGGAGGTCADGDSYITWSTAGTRLGSRVN